jgi:type I restriction enzyme S subunit
MKQGWAIKKMGEVIVENKKSTLKSKGNFDGDFPFFISGKTIKTIDKSIIDGENIYLPTGGNFFIHFYCGKASYSTDTWSLRTNRSTSIKYLFYYLLLNEKLIGEKYFKGATIKHLQKKDFKDIEIPLPPFPEQQRIVSILDECFAAIDKAKANAEQNLKNAAALFESYLQGVFENANWDKRKLSEVAKHSLGKMLDKNKNKGEPKKYLRNQNVRWFEFDLSDLNEMPFLENEREKYTAIKGDVMICEGGYPGRAAIWEEDYPIYFQKAIHRIRFHNEEYNKWLLFYLFILDKTGKLKSHFTGTGIQHFTGDALGKLIIPFPPLNKVTTIVHQLDALRAETQKLEAVYQKKIADLEELKKSILKKAFAGELKNEKAIAV